MSQGKKSSLKLKKKNTFKYKRPVSWNPKFKHKGIMPKIHRGKILIDPGSKYSRCHSILAPYNGHCTYFAFTGGVSVAELYQSCIQWFPWKTCFPFHWQHLSPLFPVSREHASLRFSKMLLFTLLIYFSMSSCILLLALGGYT